MKLITALSINLFIFTLRAQMHPLPLIPDYGQNLPYFNPANAGETGNLRFHSLLGYLTPSIPGNKPNTLTTFSVDGALYLDNDRHSISSLSFPLGFNFINQQLNQSFNPVDNYDYNYSIVQLITH